MSYGIPDINPYERENPNEQEEEQQMYELRATAENPQGERVCITLGYQTEAEFVEPPEVLRYFRQVYLVNHRGVICQVVKDNIGGLAVAA